MTNRNAWELEQLAALKDEANRLLKRIKVAESELNKTWVKTTALAPVKRASLDLNAQAVILRKGYLISMEAEND